MTKKELLLENQRLRKELIELGRSVELYSNPPEGCKRGAWCLSCQYGYHGQRGYYTNPMIAVECCYGACKNFAPREG